MKVNILPTTKQLVRLDPNAQMLLYAWVQLGCPKEIQSLSVISAAGLGMESVPKAVSDLSISGAIEVHSKAVLTKVGESIVKRMHIKESSISPIDANVEAISQAVIEAMNEWKGKYLKKGGRRVVTPAVKKLVRSILMDPCPIPDDNGNKQEWRASHFTEVVRYKALKCVSDPEWHSWEYFRPATILAKENFFKYLDKIMEDYA